MLPACRAQNFRIGLGALLPKSREQILAPGVQNRPPRGPPTIWHGIARPICSSIRSRSNAHITAVDALWAGLPVLTWQGESFAGRVAAGLPHVIGLPELIAMTAEDERRAIELGSDPAEFRPSSNNWP
jgi:Glycosyl transferase family 41